MAFERLGRFLSRFRRHSSPKYITLPMKALEGSVQSPATVLPEILPKHVAIIMDGNGRWAKRRNLPRSAGHAAGTEALRDIIRASDDWGIRSLTIYAFSTENWARSKEEIDALMGLLLKYFASEIDELYEKNVRIRILGDIDGLPEAQRTAVINAMDRTKENTGLNLNIALNYGGRAELVRCARLLAERVKKGELEPESINEEEFSKYLYTAGQEDVDLLIRTSGEMRLSNFLPWQSTYAEFVFDSIYWPDFDRSAYLRALEEYASRNRRFGAEKADCPPVINDPSAKEDTDQPDPADSSIPDPEATEVLP